MKHRILIVLCAAVPLFAELDEAFFFRATPLFETTRIARRGLTTVNIKASYGSTDHARSGHASHDVHLWDIWGLSNMQQLGVGVPGKDLSNQLDLLLELLEMERSRIVHQCQYEEWASYSINGRLRVLEGVIDGAYNITKNFFVYAHLPVRSFFVGEVIFHDRSPVDTIVPNNMSPLWIAFQNSFDAVLTRWGLSREKDSITWFGDLSLYGGYTYNYEESENLDFIDATFQIGIIVPTSKKKNQDKIFSLPTGYDGHSGISVIGDIAFGFYDWLTIAAHVHAIGFFGRTACIRIKTGAHQSGLIYLAKEKSRIHRGTQIQAGLMLKADHVAAGFSAAVAYSFAQKNRDTVRPCNPLFSSSIASSEGSRLSWKMHTINLVAEYDFSCKKWPVGPRVGFFYDAQIAGKRVFKTNMVAGGFGIDCILTF